MTPLRAIAIQLFCLLPIALAGEFLHPRLQSGRTTIRTVEVMPAKAVVFARYPMGFKELMPEASEALTSKLSASVIAAVSKHGWEARQDRFGEDALKGNAQLKFAVEVLQSKFDRLAGELFRNPKAVRKGGYSLGADVKKLGLEGQSLALLFMRGGHETNALWFDHWTATVTLADVSNGDVLFHFDGKSSGMEQDLSLALRKIPR